MIQKYILISMMLFFSSCSEDELKGEDEKINVQDIPTLLNIGYRNNIPYFKSIEDNSLYVYNDNFYIDKKLQPPSGYQPEFINDKFVLSVSLQKSNVLHISSEEKEWDIEIESSPNKVVLNNENTKILYSVNEFDKLRIYDLETKKTQYGIKVDYEEFWMTNKSLMFSKHLTDEQSKVELCNSNHYFEENKTTILSSKDMFNILYVSIKGDYWCSSYNLGEVIISSTECENEKIILDSENFLWFEFRNELYYLDKTDDKRQKLNSLNLDFCK